MTSLGRYPVLAIGWQGRQVTSSASSLISYPSKEVFLFTNASWDLCLSSSTRALWKSNCIREGARKGETAGRKPKEARKKQELQEVATSEISKENFTERWKTYRSWREARTWLKGVEKGSHLYQVIPSLAADNEIVLKLIHRLQVSDDGKLILWDRLWAPYFCWRMGQSWY